MDIIPPSEFHQKAVLENSASQMSHLHICGRRTENELIINFHPHFIITQMMSFFYLAWPIVPGMLELFAAPEVLSAKKKPPKKKDTSED